MKNFLPLRKSWLQTFEQCPFLAQWLADGNKQPDNEFAFRGRMLHEKFAEKAEDYRVNGVPEDFKIETEDDEILCTAWTMFHEKFGEIDDCYEIMYEQKLGIDLDWNYTYKTYSKENLINGTLDIAIVPLSADRIPVIIDLKTGNVENDFVGERDIYVYLLFKYIDAMHKYVPKTIEFRRLYGKLAKWQTYYYDEKQIKGLENAKKRILDTVKSTKPTPSPGAACEYCGILSSACPLSKEIIPSKRSISPAQFRSFHGFLNNGEITPKNEQKIAAAAAFLNSLNSFTQKKIKEYILETGESIPLKTGGSWKVYEFETPEYDVREVLNLMREEEIPVDKQMDILKITKQSIKRLGEQYKGLQYRINDKCKTKSTISKKLYLKKSDD